MLLLLYLISAIFAYKNFDKLFNSFLKENSLIVRESEQRLIKFIASIFPIINTIIAIKGILVKTKN